MEWNIIIITNKSQSVLVKFNYIEPNTVLRIYIYNNNILLSHQTYLKSRTVLYY